MTNCQPIDEVFRALGHPVRMAVLERLTCGEATVSALSEPFDMALPSFMQHLRVLEDSGLLRSKKVGRDRICSLSPAPLERAEGWMNQQRALWEGRLDRLDAYVKTLAAQEVAEEKK